MLLCPEDKLFLAPCNSVSRSKLEDAFLPFTWWNFSMQLLQRVHKIVIPGRHLNLKCPERLWLVMWHSHQQQLQLPVDEILFWSHHSKRVCTGKARHKQHITSSLGNKSHCMPQNTLLTIKVRQVCE